MGECGSEGEIFSRVERVDRVECGGEGGENFNRVERVGRVEGGVVGDSLVQLPIDNRGAFAVGKWYN